MSGFGNAVRAQVRAADPEASTWVSANAGSGKTRVLTDRVARLLLRGTDPVRILCLTYTKAAASEMQNRLFSRLGEWAMMPDDRLRSTLQELGENGEFDNDFLRKARRLFANALETPGGLKIQTIHAFCDRLLRQFPLEAGVPPQFQALDGAEAKRLRNSILDQMAEDGPLQDLARELTGADIDDLLQELVAKRDVLQINRVRQIFGTQEPDPAHQMADILGSDGRQVLARMAETLEATETLSNACRAVSQEIDPVRFVDAAERLFLNGAASKAGAFSQKKPGNKTIRSKNEADFAAFDAIGDRVASARASRAAGRMAVRAARLTEFSDDFLRRYDFAKLLAGQFDFSDLIRKALYLLEDSASAQWVLYRLDGGIDHILVDEAQDTSPEQWRIITRLTEEFTAGDAGDGRERTLFVVGDEKQSIYSFQGADPALFTDMRQSLSTGLSHTGKSLEASDLLHSFRTSDPILRLVDAVFDGPAGNRLRNKTLHQPIDAARPGRVDIWPFLEKPDARDEAPWYTPVDAPDPDDPRKTLAGQVARWIRHQIDRKVILPGTKRAITAGDFLILVQGRSVFFNHVIKALKAEGVEVAGSDRMWIARELAVMDILSLLRWADLPDDDLSLAEAMRSPLLGLSEQDLFTLAHGRSGTLWEVLRKDERYEASREMLSDILGRADFMRPFELITHVLNHHGGRKRLLARLGEEAEDAIDELLSQALRFEQTNTPTLSGFLSWFEAEDVEVKREMDQGTDQVRVMTVHGAKGLEAPIVILPDTGVRRGQADRDVILPLDQGGFVWRMPKGDERGVTFEELSARDGRKDFQKAERMRLLYVAMTRAERWLVVAGAGDKGKKPEDCWYGLIEDTIDREGDGAIPAFDPARDAVVGDVRVMQRGWVEESATASVDQVAQPAPPGWIGTNAPAERRSRPLNPSKFPGAKALPGAAGQDEASALQYGTSVHLLLEYLPGLSGPERVTAAQNLLTQAGVADADAEGAMAEAFGVLNAPELRWIWADDALAEVPITGELATLGRQRIEGIIDRLIVGPDRVVAVDFKTNAVVPAEPDQIPVGILRQLGAYADVLSQIYPDRQIETGILWTKSAHYMSADHKLVSDALRSTPTS